MIKKVIIVICASILLAGAVNQIRLSFDQQQSYNQQMDGQRLQIESKRRELMQDLEQVQAKGDLSDHDRWLIDHLSKSIEGLDKILATVDAGQQRVERHYLKNWTGIAGVLLALASFALVCARNPDDKLSAQDRTLIQQPLGSVSGVDLDRSTYRADPAPVSGGANFVTGRIRQHSPTELRIRGGKIIKAFATAFLVGPIGYFVLDAVYLINDILNRGWDAEFSMIYQSVFMMASFGLGAVLILSSGGKNVTIDGEHKVFCFREDDTQIPFHDIASIQLNSLLVTGKRTFHNHQIQLNLKDGRSQSLLSHAGKDQMTADLILLARFTGLPVAVPA